MNNLFYVGKNRKPEIGRCDHIELYPNICRQFDVLTEFINGPCVENQKLLEQNWDQRDMEIL